MKPGFRIALSTLVIGFFFAALGAASVVICVRFFKMSATTARLVGMPVSYIIGMLLIWALYRTGRRRL